MQFYDRKQKIFVGVKPAAALSQSKIISELTAIAPDMFVSVSDDVVQFDDTNITEAQKTAIKNKITELGL